MPEPEVTCWWAWNGLEWVPALPHACPEFHVCRYPNYEGAYIGQYSEQPCDPIV